MCGKPDIPSAPPITRVPEPPEPEKVAQEVQRSLDNPSRREDGNRTLLGRYDLPNMPPNFRIPR